MKGHTVLTTGNAELRTALPNHHLKIVKELDITFGLHVFDSSSLVSVLFREAFSHPYIFFHLLVNGFSVINIVLIYVYLLCIIKIKVRWCTCSL